MSRIDSRGTKIYFVRPDDTVTRFECFDTIDPGSDDANEGSPCLDDETLRKPKEGKTPNKGTIEYTYDDANTSHTVAVDIADKDEVIQLVICSSNCTTAPTVTSGKITFPTDGDSWVCQTQLHIGPPKIEADKKQKFTIELFRGLWTRIMKTA